MRQIWFWGSVIWLHTADYESLKAEWPDHVREPTAEELERHDRYQDQIALENQADLDRIKRYFKGVFKPGD